MASQKRKTVKKKTDRMSRSKSQKNAQSLNNKQQETTPNVIVNDIKIIILFTITVLLTLSNFSIGGAILQVASRFMFGMFGIFAYIVPVALFIAIMFARVNRSSRQAIKKLIAAIIFFLMLCTFMQLVYAGTSSGMPNKNYYKICEIEKSGGGFCGYLIARIFCMAIGIYGAYIATIAIMLITVIFISEKAIVPSIKKNSKKMYDSAKEDFSNRKNINSLRNAKREKNLMKRAKKPVRGVTIAKIQDPDYQNADIHELVHNGSIYRGHIDEDIDEEHNDFEIKSRGSFENIDEQYEKNDNNSKEYVDYETGEIKYKDDLEDIHTIASTNDYIPREVFEPSSDFANETKTGEFIPKERIEVSKSAREVMNRKAFATPDIQDKKPAEISNEKPIADVDSQCIKPEYSGAIQNKVTKSKQYMMPPLSLLRKGTGSKRGGERRISGLSKTAKKLQDTLNAFGVKAHVVDESRGPSVTRYELQPETGTKVSRITSLSDDIKLNLAASDIRIEAPIPGKAAVGIEVPNDVRESVFLRDLIESEELSKHPSKIAFAAGKDIAGKVIVADIAKMPHMLIAGTTGSGKSVFTNSIIMSILYRAKPSEVRLLIVDPKVVEFGVYNGIPHLLSPVVTEPRKAAAALNWAVAEMSDRYQAFAKYNVRDLKGYNEKIKSMNFHDGDEVLEIKPQIVIIIDELADLMMVAAKEVEAAICRLAQLARAAGIHLIIATQRPSVDVVTGLIKANIPSRVALLVSSGTDSRTIIDCNGGEKLLGNGDMLFYPSGYVKPVRLQGAFVSDQEVQAVVSFIVQNNQNVEYNEEIANAELTVAGNEANNNTNDSKDALFEQAGRFIIEKGKGSTSMLQRMFKIGFNRASRIIDQLETMGVVGSDEGTKPRKVLMTMEEFEIIIQNKQ